MKDDEKSACKEIGDCSSRERCFVVTPFGSEGDPIRRHIDGVIKAAIKPVLEADGYQVIAAHTMSESGTIDKQIFKELYEDKLVIANLTQNNPNVMYELAARHCFGKPVIIIAEEGSVLPFDILRERTIFYINDAQGILDLRERLQRAVESIKFTKASSPIHDIIHSIKKDAKVYADVESGNISGNDGTTDREVMRHILEKLDELDRKIQRSTQCQSEAERHVVHYRYICELFATLPEVAESVISLKNAIVRRIGGRLGEVCRINMAEDTNKISIEFYSNEDMSYHVFQREMEEVLEDLGFQNLEIIELDRRTMRR